MPAFSEHLITGGIFGCEDVYESCSFNKEYFIISTRTFSLGIRKRQHNCYHRWKTYIEGVYT